MRNDEDKNRRGDINFTDVDAHQKSKIEPWNDLWRANIKRARVCAYILLPVINTHTQAMHQTDMRRPVSCFEFRKRMHCALGIGEAVACAQHAVQMAAPFSLQGQVWRRWITTAVRFRIRRPGFG